MNSFKKNIDAKRREQRKESLGNPFDIANFDSLKFLGIEETLRIFYIRRRIFYVYNLYEKGNPQLASMFNKWKISQMYIYWLQLLIIWG